MKGTIKVLKNGFGFIKSEETENDTFFHLSGLKDVEFDELKEGDAVTFEVGEGNNWKTQAINVELDNWDSED